MIIGACGYGATGSGIITDFLREFDDVQVFDDFEFSYAYRVDGLQDLEYHLMKQFSKSISSDAAIKRFIRAANYIKTPLIHKPTDKKTYFDLVNKYVESITQCKFKGMESIDVISGNVLKNVINLAMKKVILPKLFEKKRGEATCFWPNRDVYVSVKPENFYDASKEFIRGILVAMGADLNKTIVLDQPFEGNAPLNSFKFFDNPKAIIVDRDPRDLFLEAKHTLIAEGRFIPRHNVKAFCEYYKRIRTDRPTEDSDNILLLRFEDLMYNYAECVTKIIGFCNLGEHVRSKQFFNPQKSINNTQLIRRYPEDIEAIRYIENDLAKFLYPFEKYKDVDTSGDVFVGSAKYQKRKFI